MRTILFTAFIVFFIGTLCLLLLDKIKKPDLIPPQYQIIKEFDIVEKDTNVHSAKGIYLYKIQPKDCISCDFVWIADTKNLVVGYDTYKLVR